MNNLLEPTAGHKFPHTTKEYYESMKISKVNDNVTLSVFVVPNHVKDFDSCTKV